MTNIFITYGLDAPNGLHVEFHRVTEIRLSPDVVNIEALVESWPTMQAYTLGQDAVVRSVMRIPADGLPSAPTFLGQIKSALIGPGAFEGGSIVDPEPLDLTARKNLKWAQIKLERDRVEFGTMTWDGSEFDTNMISQQRIQGAVQLASMSLAANQTFEQDWTLADNSVRTLNASQLVSLGLALAQHVGTAHAIGRGLRAQIFSATTEAEVDAVVWPQ